MDQSKKIMEQVMEKIKTGKIKLRSKYIFLAEKLGLGSAFILTVILAILFFNLSLFYFRASDNLYYLSFGSQGILAFLESFPYLLVVSLIIFILAAGYLLKRSDFGYSRPFTYLACSLIGFIILAGTGLAFTSMAEKFEERVNRDDRMGKMLKPLFLPNFIAPKNGIAGKLMGFKDNYLILETPQGPIMINFKVKPKDFSNFKTGEIIVVVGKFNKEGIFEGKALKNVPPAKVPMLYKRINRGPKVK